MNINFWLNGVNRHAEISPDTLLIDFLRKQGCFIRQKASKLLRFSLHSFQCNDFLSLMRAASVLQESTGRPSIRTVQRPQFAVSQPLFTLKQPCFLKKSISSVSL